MVSVLYREPKLLKEIVRAVFIAELAAVSVLYREPKLLKVNQARRLSTEGYSFSALP